MTYTDNASYKTEGIARIWRDIANNAKHNSGKDGYKAWVHAAKNCIKHYNQNSEQANDTNTEYFVANLIYDQNETNLNIIAKNLEISIPKDLDKPSEKLVNSAINDKFFVDIHEQVKLRNTKNTFLFGNQDFDIEELEQNAREDIYRSARSLFTFFSNLFSQGEGSTGFTEQIERNRNQGGRNI